jgi:hypothetical protein
MVTGTGSRLRKGGLAVGYGTVPFEVVLSFDPSPPLPSPSLAPNAMVTRSADWQWRPCLIGDTCIVQRPGCHAVALRLALLGLGPREWVR